MNISNILDWYSFQPNSIKVSCLLCRNLSWVMPYRKQDLICPSFLLPFPRCKVIHNAVNDVGKKLSLQNLYPNHARLEMF